MFFFLTSETETESAALKPDGKPTLDNIEQEEVLPEYECPRGKLVPRMTTTETGSHPGRFMHAA